MLITSIPPPHEQFKEALAFLRSGDSASAVSVCGRALKQNPGDANFLCLGARANLALKKFVAAKKLLDEAIRLHPEFSAAQDVAGDLLFAQGFVGAAIKAYEQALRLDPTSSGVLSKIEKAQELAEKAETEGTQTAAIPPQGRHMAFADEIGKAEQFSKEGDDKQAEDIYRSILKRDPNHVEASRLLAGIAAGKHRYRDAEVYLRHAAKVAPDYARIWVDLTNVLRESNKLDAALECALKVLELAPNHPESHMLYAGVVGVLGRNEEAILSYKKALEIEPDRPGALCSMAHHLKTLGSQEEAIAAYRRCIEVKSDHAEAFWSLANLKTFQFQESEIAAMHALLDQDDLKDVSRVQINNALGLDRESRHDYASAFLHYQQCNSLRRSSESYDPVETETIRDRSVSFFNAEFLKKHSKNGNPDASPIFVVGLPRSGSTLLEQILASHSMVDGTHELKDLPVIVNGFLRRDRPQQQFPATLQDLEADGWHKIGVNYIESTRKYRAGGAHFIDKNPNNFAYIGLLRMALPNAKVIDARRHPLDSCFGSYKQLFASGQPFTYDLVELGEYYLQYSSLMEHWHQVAPGFVLDVQYEDVVADLETQVRRLLEFCDLPFEESCLRFHETDRAVKTASSEQVRRPIYSSSVNLWRNYEAELGDLIEVLEPLLRKLPKVDQPLCL